MIRTHKLLVLLDGVGTTEVVSILAAFSVFIGLIYAVFIKRDPTEPTADEPKQPVSRRKKKDDRNS